MSTIEAARKRIVCASTRSMTGRYAIISAGVKLLYDRTSVGQ